MSEAAATNIAPAGPLANAVSPADIAPRRMSEMGHAAYQANLPPLPPPPTAPANQQTAPEPVPGTAEEQPATPEQPEGEQEVAPTPEQLAAEWQKHKDSPDLDLEAFADKVIWTKDRDGNPVPMRVADIPRHTMLYGDYQAKTTELARDRRQLEQHQSGIQAFQRDLLSGDAEQAMKAMRWMGAEKSMHSMVVAYVKRMAELEGLPPAVQQRFIEGERARDEAEMLKRQLQARQQQEQAEAQRQQQEQGVNAPDIQHVTEHIGQRLPNIYKSIGAVSSPLFNGLDADGKVIDPSGGILGAAMGRATQGERGPDGRWIQAPVIQRGRTPTDDVIRQIVGAAWEETQRLIASSGGRQPPRQQLPPPPAATSVGGSSARPGQAGNISNPERRRLSDMR